MNIHDSGSDNNKKKGRSFILNTRQSIYFFKLIRLKIKSKVEIWLTHKEMMELYKEFLNL